MKFPTSTMVSFRACQQKKPGEGFGADADKQRQATFDCGDFLRCAGAIFLPCLTWTMEDDGQ
jgi:hypothetical protein